MRSYGTCQSYESSAQVYSQENVFPFTVNIFNTNDIYTTSLLKINCYNSIALTDCIVARSITMLAF